MIRDTRGVSSPLEYSLTIVIVSILIVGLITTMSTYVGDERETNARDQMDLVGQQVAGSLEAADRLVRSTEGNPDTVELTRRLPDQILESDYAVEITSTQVIVTSTLSSKDITVEHDVDPSATSPSNPTVISSEAEGGSVRIVYDDSSGEIEVVDT